MKTFLDLVGKQTPEENIPPNVSGDFMMRTTEACENPSEKLLGARANNAAEDSGITDPLIQGLVARLPKPDGIWPLDERAKWLRTAAGIFDLIYKARDGDHREISIKFVEQETIALPVTGLGADEAQEGGRAEFNIGASSPLIR